MRIRKPRIKPNSIDYFTECEETIAPVFHDLADLAEQRGWRDDAVAAALLSLAMAHSNRKMTDRSRGSEDRI